MFFILFMGVADSQVLSPLLAAIRAQFGKSSSDMGILFTGYSFSAGLSVLIWGPLSDVLGRKNGLLHGLIVFFAGSLVSFIATDFYILLAGRALTGMGASILSLNCISYAADFFPYTKRGWAMGSIFSSYFAALILGVPIGSWIGDRFGWNWVFFSMGGISVVLLFFTHRFLPRLDITLMAFKPKPAVCVQQYIGFIKSRSSLAALMSSLFASAGIMGFLAFLGIWLHDAFKIPGSKVGLVFLVCGATALLASPIAGSISDRVGKRVQFVASCIFLALFLFVLPGMRWGPALFGVFGMISIAAAFRQGPMEAVLSEIAPSESRGSFVALKNSFSQLGIGLATLFSGILFEINGYGAVCILCAVSNVLAAVCMLFTLKVRHL